MRGPKVQIRGFAGAGRCGEWMKYPNQEQDVSGDSSQEMGVQMVLK